MYITLRFTTPMSTLLPAHPGRARRLAYGQYVRQLNASAPLPPPPPPSTSRRRPRMLGVTLDDLIHCTRVFVCIEDDFCPICQDATRKGHDVIRQLVCNHNFHLQCVDMWFLTRSVCPLCKFDITND